MAGYVIADIDIIDPVAYEEYRKLAPATISKYGGKYLLRGRAPEVLEGTWTPKRLVVLEFESIERAREWYQSEEYGAAMEIRHRAAVTSALLVEGA